MQPEIFFFDFLRAPLFCAAVDCSFTDRFAGKREIMHEKKNFLNCKGSASRETSERRDYAFSLANAKNALPEYSECAFAFFN